MTTPATTGEMPKQLRRVAVLLIVFGIVSLVLLAKRVISGNFTIGSLPKLLPLLQILIGIGLLRRVKAARVAAMVWFALAMAYAIGALLKMLANERPTYAAGPTALVFVMMALTLAFAIYGYRVLTRPNVSAHFASVE